MTPKKIPPGVLENYLGWMKPALAGLDDPRFPSLVGVIIINGNLPVPSGYSRGTEAPRPRSGHSRAGYRMARFTMTPG